MTKVMTWAVRFGCAILIVEAVGFSAMAAERFYADPVGSNAVNPTMYTIDKESLVINNTEDRVGARVKLCKTLSDAPCERIEYVFPQLKLDKDKNLIYLGHQPIGTLKRWGMRVTLDKQYKLGHEIVSQPNDSGFDKGKETLLKVFIER